MCGPAEDGVSEEPCGTNACPATGFDGEGPGCLSDTTYMNLNTFTCYDTSSGVGEHKTAAEYENALGFVPHNFACFSSSSWSGQVCSSSTHHLTSDRIVSTDPAICQCNQGNCGWTPDRQDCSRAYEWIRTPVGTDLGVKLQYFYVN